MEMTANAMTAMPESLESRTLVFKRARRLRGVPTLSGDHGLAYQALGLASLAEGSTRVENLPDTPAMREALEAFASLGLLRSELLDGQTVVHGGSLGREIAASENTALTAYASPTTETGDLPAIAVRDEILALVLAGIISGKSLKRTLALDTHSVSEDVTRLIQESLPLHEVVKKPGAVTPPEVTAAIAENTEANRPPFTLVQPGQLALKVRRAREGGIKPKAFHWDDPQAKVLLLTQALAANEATFLDLRDPGTDLFETLVSHFHGTLQVDKGAPPEGDELARRIARQMKAAGNKEDTVRYRLEAGASLKTSPLTLPRDVGEASMWALAAILVKGSDLVLDNVLLNPSRTAFFSALKRMGADLEIVTRREKHGFTYGQVRVRSSELLGKRFDANALSGMRDEIFLLIVAAAFAEGETVLRDITFLRGYHTDLLKSFLITLKNSGVEAGEFEDGIVVRGRSDYDGNSYDAEGHHGLAAACVAMALKSHGNSTVTGAEGLLWRSPHLLEQLEALQVDAKDDKSDKIEKPEKTGKGDKADRGEKKPSDGVGE